MLTHNRIMVLFCFFLLLGICLPLHSDICAKENKTYFDSLQKKLIKDGFNSGRIKKIYEKPGVFFEKKGLSQFFAHNESRLNYDQFLSNKSIKKGKKYIQKHLTELNLAEKTYGVEKEIITAIILVETRLGTFLGNTSILNTLSSMSALDDTNVRDMFWKESSKKSKRSRKKYDKWADRKSNWAYTELKAFLTYTEREKIDPLSIKGSYAGALGIPQFMPSNIIRLGKDGNNSGNVDLFNHADAIASVANYLKHYGWHPQIKEKKAYKVLYKYNHSKYYVNTLLKLSKKLKS